MPDWRKVANVKRSFPKNLIGNLSDDALRLVPDGWSAAIANALPNGNWFVLADSPKGWMIGYGNTSASDYYARRDEKEYLYASVASKYNALLHFKINILNAYAGHDLAPKIMDYAIKLGLIDA